MYAERTGNTLFINLVELNMRQKHLITKNRTDSRVPLTFVQLDFSVIIFVQVHVFTF